MKILTTGIININKDKFKNVKNSEDGFYLNKPIIGGLWGSTYLEDDYYPSSWYDFVSDSGIDKNFNYGILYSLLDSSNIFELDSLEKHKFLKDNYCIIDSYKGRGNKKYAIDWEKLSRDYDGFHLTYDMFMKLRNFKYLMNDLDFYSWDCESYLIFNLDCIDMNSIEYIDLEKELENRKSRL